MKLQFNAVGQLQTAVVCPSCGKTGKEWCINRCCFEYMLRLLGIQGRGKTTGEMLRDKDGFCYAYENCNEEHCKGYKPYPRMFTNGCNSECQHHSLNGRCTL